jgi:hypothetical protein
MAKNENFGLQRRAGPEQPGHKAPNQPEEVDHRSEYHPIHRYRAADFGFAGRTGGAASAAFVIGLLVAGQIVRLRRLPEANPVRHVARMPLDTTAITKYLIHHA